MTEANVFQAAVEATRGLSGKGAAVYCLYCSEQRRAWVAAAEVPYNASSGISFAAFTSALAGLQSGLFLVAPDLSAADSAWPVAVFLEPTAEIEIDAAGIRWLSGTPDAVLTAATAAVLNSDSVAEGTARGLLRKDQWKGEDDASFSGRLESAIAATRGRTGKVIVSRRYERDTANADPVALFALFGAVEPNAAAIHYVSLPGGLVSMGTSPENIVELHSGVLSIDAIAGTKPRTGDTAKDEALRAELLASTKERHEHALAVERARAFAENVCVNGSAGLAFERHIRELRAVQHLHSRASGKLAPELDFVTLLGRCHPPLTSYPPELAAQFAPPWPGHFYGGMVGRVSGTDGSAFLNLRCLEIEGKCVNIYAGVGVVNGSSVESELNEVQNKLGTATDVIERWLAPT